MKQRLRIRKAEWQDARLFWQWANDPTVRSNAFHSEPIPFDSHLEWFEKKVASADTRIWILQIEQQPVAQIRYDRVDTETAEIGFSVDSNHRGHGLGTEALRLTTHMACMELRVSYLKGVVFSANQPSRRAFRKAGFKCVGQTEISDKSCHIFIWECISNHGADS